MSNTHSDKLQQLLRLPEQAPWFGPREMGFIGSGLIGCGMDTQGTWNNLVGTAYSMESFLKKERLKAIINGVPCTLNGDMHRAAGTGIFYSTLRYQDVVVYVVDFAIMHKPYITRLIAAHNTSGSSLTIQLYVEIKRSHHAGFHTDTGKTALTLAQPDSRLLTIAFAGYPSSVRIYDEETEAVINTAPLTLAPGEVALFPLCHYAHSDSLEPLTVAEMIAARNGLADLHACLDEWTQWLAKGRDLGFIKDERAWGIVESCIITIRMEQGENGGIMATPGGPTSSYIRDNHSSLRGLMAAGHVEEARRYLLHANSLCEQLVAKGDFGIPTSFPIGTDQSPFFGFGTRENWACETPGLFVLTAKRYFEVTKDVETLKQMDSSIRYAITVQLEFAKAHDWKLIFNGDETESGGCGITMKECVTHHRNYYSMSSQVICIASLRFFIDYLSLTGHADEVPEFRKALVQLEQALDKNFWSEEGGYYLWLRTLDMQPPSTMMCNFQIFPLYFGNISNRDRAARSALALKSYVTERGFIPNQPLGENRDFTGHNLGYLLYAMTELDDPMQDPVYESLVNGGTVGCWGMWGEAYYDDGTPYGYGQTWDQRAHNLRPFESGVNIEAIIRYWERKHL